MILTSAVEQERLHSTDQVSHAAIADRWERIAHGARLATAALSVLAVLAFLLVALKRLRYPFELDRMESSMMTTVWRVAHGLPVYVRPSLEWVPFLYSPLFFYVSAFAARFVGLGYAALRLVSIAATLGSCAVIGAMVYRETRDRFAALAGVGLFAMLYSLVLSWYDIGRVDSLALFFFLLAVYCMRFSSPLLAAVVWVLAFQTKQSFLPVAVLAFAVDWRRPGRLLLGLGTFALLAAASVWYCNHTTHGWYSYYVFGSVPELGLSPFFAKTYLPFDLLRPLGLALGLVAFSLWLKPLSWRESKAFFYGWLSLLIGGGIWFARAHVGSYFNTLMPVYAWICVLFGLAIARLTAKDAWGDVLAPTPLQFGWVALVWLVAFMQIGMHLYRPGAFAQSADAARIRLQFLERLRETPGDIWIVNHSYDSLLAGKRMHAEMDSLDAVLGRGDGPSVQEVRQAIRDHHFAAILLDRGPETYSPKWLFDGPDFQAQYPLHAYAPGAPPPGSGDQPVIMYLACDLPAPVATALAVDTTYVQRANCTK